TEITARADGVVGSPAAGQAFKNVSGQSLIHYLTMCSLPNAFPGWLAYCISKSAASRTDSSHNQVFRTPAGSARTETQVGSFLRGQSMAPPALLHLIPTSFQGCL